MYEIEIDRSNCRSCGACTKASTILYLDEDELVNMEGAFIDDNIVSGFVKSLYDVETSASICPEDCFTVYDENDDVVEIERHAKI